MSWDILIQDFPRHLDSVSEMPNDFRPKPLGSREEVVARLQAHFPDADFTDPAWGMLDRPGALIEFNIGADAVCDSVMLHVRGGNAVPGLVAELLAALDLRAVDCQTGEFFSHSASAASFALWKTYRDRVVDDPSRATE